MKLLVVGLDGATFDLLELWIEAGYMPTLKNCWWPAIVPMDAAKLA